MHMYICRSLQFEFLESKRSKLTSTLAQLPRRSPFAAAARQLRDLRARTRAGESLFPSPYFSDLLRFYSYWVFCLEAPVRPLSCEILLGQNPFGRPSDSFSSRAQQGRSTMCVAAGGARVGIPSWQSIGESRRLPWCCLVWACQFCPKIGSAATSEVPPWSSDKVYILQRIL